MSTDNFSLWIDFFCYYMLLFTIAYGGNIALFSSVCFNKAGENQQKLKIFIKLILKFAQMVTRGHSLKEMTLLEILS